MLRARRARPIVDQYPVGEEAAQNRLELVVVRIDEAGHDDAAGGVDLVAPPADRFGPTAMIFLPSISTSALGKSPTFGSIDITEPPRMM